MADPLTMAVVAAVGATVFDSVQGVGAARDQKSQLKQQAAQTGLESKAAANRIRARSRRLAAAQRARASVAGVNLSDSLVDVQYDSAQQYELDALTTLYQGSVKANTLKAQGSAAGKQGPFGAITGSLNAAGTVLGGIAINKALSENPEIK